MSRRDDNILDSIQKNSLPKGWDQYQNDRQRFTLTMPKRTSAYAEVQNRHAPIDGTSAGGGDERAINTFERPNSVPNTVCSSKGSYERNLLRTRKVKEKSLLVALINEC